jgi:hypothetical protein
MHAVRSLAGTFGVGEGIALRVAADNLAASGDGRIFLVSRSQLYCF